MTVMRDPDARCLSDKRGKYGKGAGGKRFLDFIDTVIILISSNTLFIIVL